MGLQNTMRALSDPIRREILNLLKAGRMSAGDIVLHFDVTGASVDVRVLKDILGHEQLNTTQIYTHVSNRSMEDAMNENPPAKVKKNKL